MSNGNPIYVTVNGDDIAVFGGAYGYDSRDGSAGIGVGGAADVGIGVLGLSTNANGIGIQGENTSSGVAIVATSDQGIALRATTNGDSDAIIASTGSAGHAAVAAHNDAGSGVYAFSGRGNAIYATNLPGKADADAILAFTVAPNSAAVAGHNNGNGRGVWAFSQGGIGLWAQGNPAGYFNGDVNVTGDLILANTLVSSGGDVAEDFDVEAEPLNTEPGTVLVIAENGNLCTSDVPYDTRVAGVVAGAGTLKPAVILQRVSSPKGRSPLALVGKVFCKVDATFGKIVAGDLLTTSSTPGYAMKVSDRSRAVGAIVGKALASLDSGLGLIPMLVSPR